MPRIYPVAYEGQAPPEFGINANILKTRRFDLSITRNLEEIDIGGTCLWAISATSLSASIDIYINDQLRDPITFQQGMFIRGIPFSRLFVSHEAQPDETITLFYAREQTGNIQIVNPTMSATSVIVTNDVINTLVTNDVISTLITNDVISVIPTKAAVFNTTPDIAMVGLATTIILPSNPARRTAYITNLISNIQTLRIGDTFAAANRGTPLAPGDSIIIETTEAIYGYKPVAGNENVAVSWTED